MLGGTDATRIAVALIASLGVHAGAALWVDGWSYAAPEPSARSVQVRLTHAPAREVLATRAPEHTLPAAAAPQLTAAAMSGSALAAVAPATVAAEPPPPGAAASVTATPVTARAVRRAAAPRPAPRRPAPVAALAAAQPPQRTAPAIAAPAAVESQPVPRRERPSAASGERAVDTPPKLMAGNAPPQYPATARRRGEQGQVLLRVQVFPDGTTSEPAVVRSSGVASLDRAARVAVARWRFTPASYGGRAVAATVEVPVVFRLDGPG